MYIYITERRSGVFVTPASYSIGPVFKYRPISVMHTKDVRYFTDLFKTNAETLLQIRQRSHVSICFSFIVNSPII
jgi:hypothetical protein